MKLLIMHFSPVSFYFFFVILHYTNTHVNGGSKFFGNIKSWWKSVRGGTYVHGTCFLTYKERRHGVAYRSVCVCLSAIALWCPSSAHAVLLLKGTGVTNTDVCSAGQWDKTDGETLRKGISILHCWQRTHRRCCLQALHFSRNLELNLPETSALFPIWEKRNACAEFHT